MVGDLTVSVLPEQARMLADALAKRDALSRDVDLLVSVLAAGHVPQGSQLAHIDVDTGALVFHVPHAVSQPEVPDAG